MKHILESVVKVFELCGSSSSVLEVKYLEEVEACLGPTSRLYALVSEEFEVSKIWRDSGHGTPGAEASPFVHHESGLYPVPIGAEDMGGLRRRQFVAKALFDSRIIDLSFNKVRLKLVLGEEVSSYTWLAKILALIEETVTVEDPALDFTLLGYDIELKNPCNDNRCPIIRPVCPLKAILGSESTLQAKPFREGISKVFPIGDRQGSTVEELMMLFGNGDEDCTVETLSEALEADHGFNPESRAIWNLLEIMAEYDASTRLPVTRRNNQISGRSFRRVFLQLVQCVHYEFGNCNVNDDERGPHK
ncbi:uncharacterized protein C8R40DRAFT_1069013 [Lentinula edodes]|uniref:uncharacterized protein n=1 Tax=Lentinula edodes TaxID=5353 RepID=UPI001E8CB95D|nr:uncharacterized protein C8R40DRAFT_1069013 [Lentinula edodes]KAH7875792.1 hypothetical protein C8R40DRAFT_1069013 [Lentinula edodes]